MAKNRIMKALTPGQLKQKVTNGNGKRLTDEALVKLFIQYRAVTRSRFAGAMSALKTTRPKAYKKLLKAHQAQEEKKGAKK